MLCLVEGSHRIDAVKEFVPVCVCVFVHARVFIYMLLCEYGWRRLPYKLEIQLERCHEKQPKESRSPAGDGKVS